MRKRLFLCVMCMTLLCGTQCYATEMEEIDHIEENIEVKDVEIANYEKELNVDATMNLTVTVLPENATDSTVTYTSSKPEIATVSSTGEVKGIAPGPVDILVKAGTITKKASIVVKIPTTAIQLNSDYQVMKQNSTFQLKATAQPAGAAGHLTYRSTNEKVATVSATGLIKAKACGNAAIIVTNGDMHVSVSVIVNQDGVVNDGATSTTEIEQENNMFPEEVNAQKYAVISKEMLKYFYQNKKMLTVQGDGYTLYVDGKDIVNYENELKTLLLFQTEEKGTSFVVNAGKHLCGKIKIDLKDTVTDEKYLYLYNEQKDKYQQIATDDISELTIDTAGKYLITSEKLREWNLNVIWLGVGVVVLLAGIGVYIGVKKQYWFW